MTGSEVGGEGGEPHIKREGEGVGIIARRS